MGVLSILLAAAFVVKQDGTQLREGCEQRDRVVTTLSAGTAAAIRFSMASNDGACYKVAISSEGKTLEGYLPASALSGLEAFEAEVRSAPVILGPRPAQGAGRQGAGGRAIQANNALADVRLPINSPQHPIVIASSLLDQRQPRAALEVAEKAMKVYGRDYQFLVLAGIAAERSDQPRQALDYLREAEQLHQDRSIEQLIGRLEKEVAGDRSGQKLFGNRFLLRYEEGSLDPDVARSMVALLEQEFSRIAGELGCRTDERITTVVQSRQSYRASSSVAEWSAGHFDGSKIRVPVAESRAISPQTREAFSHELVHACLANLGQWPAWVHEGFAQKLTGRAAGAATRARIQSMLRSNKLPRLDNMSQSWSRLSGEHAAIAYEYALVAVETLYQAYSGQGIQNILRYPDRLPQITAHIDSQLAQ